jgi:hypothetical protein
MAENQGKNVLVLLSTNEDVDKINKLMLKWQVSKTKAMNNRNEIKKFKATDENMGNTLGNISNKLKKHLETLKKSECGGMQAELSLCVGARVMLVRNLYEMNITGERCILMTVKTKIDSLRSGQRCHWNSIGHDTHLHSHSIRSNSRTGHIFRIYKHFLQVAIYNLF